MNEFCVHCGILLPIKSDNTSLCNVCKRESKLREDFADYIKRKCDCDYCARSDETNVLKEIHSPAEDGEECIENVAELVTINKNNNSNRPNFYHDVHDDELCGQSENRLNEQRQRFEFKAHTSEQVDKTTDELDQNYLTIESRQTEDGNKLREDIDIEQEWKIEQVHLKEQLILQDTPNITALVSDGKRRKPDGSRYYVGGVDISFIKDNSVDACACLCVVRMPDLEVVYEKMEMVQLSQPYIPGFLAFREVPSLLKLLGDLKAKAPQYFPDVILLDGNGILHPRGFGLACQLGVLAQVPTVGVAKTLISAQGINEDQKHKNKKLELKEAGDGFELISDTGEILGMCLRAHDKATNPVYVSAGHMISLKSAVWLTLECSKYRIPEPIRRADIDSREYIRQGKKELYEFIAD